MELVGHSRKWATSSVKISEFPRFSAKTKEPVDHSGKWTTGSHKIGDFP